MAILEEIHLFKEVEVYYPVKGAKSKERTERESSLPEEG